MAYVLKNRVQETTNTVGTGDLTVSGAVAKCRTFAASGIVAGSTFPYAIDVPSGAWETGTGTWNVNGTISRAFDDSSTGSALNLAGEPGTTVAIVPTAAFGTEAYQAASPGAGIQSAAIDRSGHLLLTLTDGNVLDAGSAVGPPGMPGAVPPLAVPAATATVPSLAALQVLLTDGTFLTGTQLAALLGASSIPGGSPASGGATLPGALTVADPEGATAGNPYAVSGTYANAAPAALDYSTNGGETWTAAVSPTISGGVFSFSAAGLAAGSYVMNVRDHNAPSVSASSADYTVGPAAALAYVVRNLPGYAWPTSANLAGGGYVNVPNGVVVVLAPSGQTPGALDLAFGASGTEPPVKGAAGGDYGVNGYDSGAGTKLDQTAYPGGWSGGPGYIWKNSHATGSTRLLYLWVLPTDGGAPPAVLGDTSGNPIALTVTY